ncbi:DUF2800 domain-containing protein [Lachnotalea glycerini]|uniref:DUF2800 domain-containing protein n=1 Tax=Lachnotalea glycerini TaxID=1763509 RepID=A0A371JE26_9FIRM|nr:DUF2800 domain-containing protein [Lachnotalea glycerini]RDY30975.1 DUF2800 domain-containing protein [Lachnotalea glycerini]
MGRHALLSASSSRRWLNCTPSARLEQQFPEDGGSIYAEEGTAAHALAEHKLKRLLKKRSRRPVSVYDCDEMEDCMDEYVSFAMEQIEKAKQSCKDPVILIEQHLDFSRYVPEGFGTGDLVIVADGTLFIIDLKYGKGIAVEAEENPQMMLYALGALELFDAIYDIERVSLIIHQPRLESVSTWEITVDGLRKWAEEYLIPRAALANKGQGEFVCGSWCRFCKARNQCRVRAESFLELAKMEFCQPALLSDEEIAEVLKKADELAKWAADIYAYAQDEAITHGKHWNGFKLVEGRSNRKYSSDEEAAEAAKAAGYTDIYKQALIGITEMEKLMGKKKFVQILGKFVYKPQGKITLVPESDKRQPVETADAEADFKEE